MGNLPSVWRTTLLCITLARYLLGDDALSTQAFALRPQDPLGHEKVTPYERHTAPYRTIVRKPASVQLPLRIFTQRNDRA